MGFPAFGTADRLRRHEPRRPAMARVADHLSVSALEQHYRSCKHATAARHFHTIWLLAKGHQISEVAATVCFAPRWVERLLARYNAQGPHALGDLRCRNGASPSILKPDLLDKLSERLLTPPPDGGLWSSSKVAAWMAAELGLAHVAPQRGWEALKALGWSPCRSPVHATPAPQRPRTERPLKKTGRGRGRGSRQAPGQTGRGLGHGRAPHRVEADPAPGLGAKRPAAHSPRPSPLRVALRHGFCLAQHGRDVLVRVERHLQAVLCRAAGAVCTRGWRGPRADHRARARQGRLA